ncbi:MAG: family 10 glycosylhydrolase [Defluviitaleaceae bacterium]|nr:family 10 glycosylhydrolase [Defluviitaleaceae bacterium]
MKKIFIAFAAIIVVAAAVFVIARDITVEIEYHPTEEALAESLEPSPTPVPLPAPEPEIICLALPEYIPTPLTYEEQLAALTSYALNRHAQAQAQGINISLGRHMASDMEAFLDAIHASQSMDCLQYAIDTFRNAIIDPADRYRPFLATIAQGEDFPQKRHLRGAWIATVLNIDWPSVEARGTSPAHVDLQKYELRQRFDEIADLGFNAVIFQISPTGDAFFRSEISPWSAWLTGETNFTGVLRDSGGVEFDPLEYAIRLARGRNIEFHAWFNPYRITHTLANYREITLSSTGEPVTSLAQIRQEWSQIPGTAFYLFDEHVKIGENRYVVDPGTPGVNDWIVRRVLEVIENYDIDAVHFDDYFYPSDFPTRATPAERRQNTEKMIREVSEAIREAAPWVKFGISPGGVWKSSAAGNTGLDGGGFDAGTGSPSTTTWSNYHSSFADTRRWVIENYIDYLTPQIYWEWTHNTAPYGVIADWWARLFHDFGENGDLRNSRGEHTNAQLFIGVGLYRMDNMYRSARVSVPQKWRNAPAYEYEGKRTLLRQEAYNLGNPNISGSMIFSQNQMRPGREHGMRYTMETLRGGMWRCPALVPPMPHLGGAAPSRPTNLRTEGTTISWENTETSTDPLIAPRYFVIYRAATERININNPANIFKIIPAQSGQIYYYVEIPQSVDGYHFAITAVNRLHDESTATAQ